MSEHRQALLEPGEWRPLPTASWLTKPFWDAAAEGKLVVQRCADCGQFIFRPQYACTTCLSTNVAWVESSAQGTVHSFSVVKRPAFPELPDVYVVVVVEMAEGWYMMSNLINCPESAARIGMTVRIAFRDCGGMSLPFVEPV